MSGVRIAAWQHVEGRRGFEVARLEAADDGGYVINGHSTGEDEGMGWGMHYTLRVDASWATRSLERPGSRRTGAGRSRLTADGAGAWTRDGAPRPSSTAASTSTWSPRCSTNTLAVRRLGLEVEGSGTLDVVWIGRPAGREVERMPQRYTRVGIRGFRFEVVGGDFEADLEIDEFGLVLVYPGLAQRVA